MVEIFSSVQYFRKQLDIIISEIRINTNDSREIKGIERCKIRADDIINEYRKYGSESARKLMLDIMNENGV